MQQIICLFFLLVPITSFAQQNGKCHDIVGFRDGSVLRGTVTKYDKGGDFEMTTLSGVDIRMAASNIRNINQKCPEFNQYHRTTDPNLNKKDYTGWYNATRFMLFVGSGNGGAGAQHSFGMQFRNFMGVGIGAGMERLGLVGGNTFTIPLFAEMRGYLLEKRISPFYVIGTGWASIWNTKQIEKRKGVVTPGNLNEWKGGWMGHGQLGVIFDSQFFLHVGLRYQHLKYHDPRQPWSNYEISIRQERVEFGLGFIIK